jgi:hypothetical protein
MAITSPQPQLTDAERLTSCLRTLCLGKANAHQEPVLARWLGWSVRHLQQAAESLGNETGMVGTCCGKVSGLYWIETAEEAAEVERHFRRRALPMLRRRGAIRRRWLVREQLELFEVAA